MAVLERGELGDPLDRVLLTVAADMNRYFKKKGYSKAYFIALGSSGERDLILLEDKLQQYTRPAFGYRRSVARIDRGVYDLSDVNIDDDTDAIILWDNQIDTGSTVARAVHDVLPRLPPRMTYIATEADWITEGSIANFAGIRKSRNYVGVEQYMKLKMPAEYEELAARDLFRLMDSEKKPLTTEDFKMALVHEERAAALATDGTIHMAIDRLDKIHEKLQKGSVYPNDMKEMLGIYEETRDLMAAARRSNSRSLDVADAISDISGHRKTSVVLPGEEKLAGTVLLLEDDVDTSKPLEVALRDAGYEVIVSRNVNEALASYVPDAVVIADIYLENSDSKRFIESLTSMYRAKVIAVSVRDDIDPKDLLALGVTRFIRKKLFEEYSREILEALKE